MAGDPDATPQLGQGTGRRDGERLDSRLLPQRLCEAGDQPVGGFAAIGAEEIERRDLSLPDAEAGQLRPRLRPLLRAGLAPQPGGQRAGFLGERLVVLVARRVEQAAHLLVGQAVDQPRLADHGFAAALGDLPQQPGEILLGLLAGRQGIDGILDRDRADALQAPPHLDPQIGRLGRDLVHQQQPAILRACAGIGLRSGVHVTTLSQEGDLRKHLYQKYCAVSFNAVGPQTQRGCLMRWITRERPEDSTGSPVRG